MPALGDYVWVYWNVGTPDGLAGTVSGEEYTARLGQLIAAGIGTLTDRPSDDVNAPPPLNPNAAVSVGAVTQLIAAIFASSGALTGATSLGTTIAQAATPAAVRAAISAASPADVAAAIATLVNSAPAQLDTINELAAALGNDASYANTITTALGLRALATDVYTKTAADSLLAGKAALLTGRPPLPGGVISTKQRRGIQNVACTVGTSAALAGAAWSIRHAVTVPVPTTRYRFRIANRAGQAVGATALAFTGLWFGAAARDTAEGTPNGNFATAPTSIQAAFNLDTAGTDYVSTWITGVLDPTLLYLVSYGVTIPAGNYATNNTECWVVSGNTAGGTQNLTAPTAFAAGPADFRIEYETAETYPAGLWLGASISGAFQSEGQVIRNSFPQLYGRANRHMVNQSPVVSGTAADFETTPATNWRWLRNNPSGSTPNNDYLVISADMVINSISAGASLAAIKVSLGNIIAYARTTLGIQRAFITTATSGNNANITKLNAGYAVGATSIVVAAPSPLAGYIGIGQGTTFEIVQVTGTITGTGPYTIPVSALAKAHLVGERVVQQSEALRYAFNLWVRKLPFGILAVIDAEQAVRDPLVPWMLNPDYAEADYLHIRDGGQEAIANTFPVLV